MVTDAAGTLTWPSLKRRSGVGASRISILTLLTVEMRRQLSNQDPQSAIHSIHIYQTPRLHKPALRLRGTLDLPSSFACRERHRVCECWGEERQKLKVLQGNRMRIRNIISMLSAHRCGLGLPWVLPGCSGVGRIESSVSQFKRRNLLKTPALSLKHLTQPCSCSLQVRFLSCQWQADCIRGWG